MNVYQKLSMCRVLLQASAMKKSGHNKFAGYQYFELGDFLPTINKLFSDNGLCSIMSFGKDYAELQIINCDKPEEVICFSSPMAEANLKGAHPIQCLGAVETYQRRYLYMTALEIVEHDALDSSEPLAKKGNGKGVIKPTDGVLESFDTDEQEFLKSVASEVLEAIKESANDAYSLLEEKHLDNDEKIGVWSLLDSKTRSALKKIGEQRKYETISELASQA